MTEDLKVKHGYVEAKEELARFRNSKYVQSEIGYSYKLAKKFLTEGRFVCFSGTQCQKSVSLFVFYIQYTFQIQAVKEQTYILHLLLSNCHNPF